MNKFLACIFIIALIVLGNACGQREREGGPTSSVIKDSFSFREYLLLILSMDTFPLKNKEQFVDKQIQKLENLSFTESKPYRYYFKASKFELNDAVDSAKLIYEEIDPLPGDNEIAQLKKFKLLDIEISGGTSAADDMTKLLEAVHSAETSGSKVTYKFYDLLARAYYQNRNEVKSMEYADLYFNNHPFKSHPVIKQRYYDISFLLASRMNDVDKMMQFNDKARLLAEEIGDSTAIARSYDNEAQVYAKQKQYVKALGSSKKYFRFLKEKNNLNEVAYNNLANSFLLNGQIDSAIFYFKSGVQLSEQKPLMQKTSLCYNGLRVAYLAKKDYYNAMQAADSAYKIELRSIRNIEESKIAEMHEKYQAEKKDRSISELQNTNLLNKKIINQQRWLFAGLLFIGLAILSFLYIFQRQHLLKSKNELLGVENKRLNAEQKLLQSQLNPHFVFNAIANLQSLIGSGEKALSMRYLSSFSQLLRNILEQSRKDLISLEEEIDTLKNYLGLQQMRFHNVFEFYFNIDENIDPQNVLIPPMIIQPFLENAVEHGFRNIDYKGKLVTAFMIKNNRLAIEIDDNGCGLQKDTTGKKKSLSGVILKERLKILFNKNEDDADLKIIDKSNYGQKGVLIKISLPVIKE